MSQQNPCNPLFSISEFGGDREKYLTYLERTEKEIIGAMNSDPASFDNALRTRTLLDIAHNPAFSVGEGNSTACLGLRVRELALVCNELYKNGRFNERRYTPYNEVFSVGGTSIAMKVLSPERARIEEEALRLYAGLSIMGNGDGACQVPLFIDRIEDGDHAILLIEALKGKSVPERLGELRGDYFSGDDTKRSQARKEVNGLFSGLIQNLTFYQKMPPKFNASKIQRKNYSDIVKGSLENLVGFFGLDAEVGSLDGVVEDNLRDPRYVRFRDSYLHNFNVNGRIKNLDYGKTNLEVVDSEDAVMMIENPWLQMSDEDVKLLEMQYLVNHHLLQKEAFDSIEYPFFCDVAEKLFVRGNISEHMKGLEQGAEMFVSPQESSDYWHNRAYIALARHLRLASNYADIARKHGDSDSELREYMKYHLAMADKALGKINGEDPRILGIRQVVSQMIPVSFQ